MSTKITICGDLHLSSNTPKSRIDDYQQSCLDKLDALCDMMLQTNSTMLILEGDIFHTPKQPSDFEVRVIKAFKKFKKYGVDVFTIIGNHDVPNENPDNVDKTSLGVLLEAEVIKNTDYIFIGNELHIVFNNYKQPIPKADSKLKTALVSHSYYDFDLSEESLHEKDLIEYGYDYYFFGHDHTPYDDLVTDNFTLYRTGSLTRGTAHGYQLNRKIEVLQISIDLGVITAEHKEIPCKSADKIFPSHILDKVSCKSIQNLMMSFDELIDKVYNNDTGSGIDIYAILDSLEVRDEVKSCVEMYLVNKGILKK